MKIRFHLAVLLLLAGTVVLASVPAGVILNRRLAGELEGRVRQDLVRAGMILEDRSRARADALMMHAKDQADAEGLAQALARGQTDRAVGILTSARILSGEVPLLVSREGRVLTGPAPEPGLVRATRQGELPVDYVFGEEGARAVALAPVAGEDGWRGAAGVAEPVDDALAGTLAGLTRSHVLILGPDGSLAGASSDEVSHEILPGDWSRWRNDGQVHETELADRGRHWLMVTSLGPGAVIFLRSADEELAVLPGLRRGALLAGVLALGLALLVGAVFSRTLTRPVRSLAQAAGRVADGDFQARVQGSAIREVDRLARAFEQMKESLAARLRELARANRELEDRQERLAALQAEIIQRDRLVASGRLVAELAHEIRNPVANIRNCLEVVSRRLDRDPEAREFAEMAIDELLRMHDLAEQMLDLNRPADPEAGTCSPALVAREAAALFRAGSGEGEWSVRVEAEEGLEAHIPPDALKQVLLNLVENAREAAPDGGTLEIRVRGEEEKIRIEVLDDGPGIPPENLSRIFDPFFTTKGEVSGVGLGLFVAEGLIRRHGGRLTAENRNDRTGARFVLELLREDGTAEAGTGPEPVEIPSREERT